MPSPIKIAVVGSLNIDYFVQVEEFPQPGETALADKLEIRFGGKGANQAVAASRLGAQVEMIGCLGDDEMGRHYLARLAEFGIGTAGVRLIGGVATGSAFITLDAGAENTIIVVPGTNGWLSAEQVEAQAAQITGADCLILQNEVPAAANAAAVALARAGGTRVFYNPAPWRDRADWMGCADCVIVNETEAANLLGSPVMALEQLAESPGLVITRGADSTLANLGEQLIERLPPGVEPVDTVGAGDTFVGALAVYAAACSSDLSEALGLANSAAARATQHRGAQEEVATLDELDHTQTKTSQQL